MPNPYLHFDLYAAVILAGVAQGLFLFGLFLLKPFRQPYHHQLLALLILAFTAIILEIFLCYTGLIVHALHLVDFSEPANFLIGPTIYLFLRGLRGQHLHRKDALHFLPFVLYLAHLFFFLLQPEGAKLNAYLSAYHPQVPLLAVERPFPSDPLLLRRYLDPLTMLNLLAYLALLARSLRKWQEQLQKNSYLITWVRALVGSYLAAFLLYLFVELWFENDFGDHFMAAFLTVQLFGISYLTITRSAFFQPLQPVKYEKSALTDEAKTNLVRKLRALEETRFYLQPSASLQDVARLLHTSPHYLSQALNETLQKTFSEYLAKMRVQEAQRLLSDPSQDHVKIEEVAERSGYLSKSAFNTAFKKHTGATPGEFRRRFQGASR